MSQQHADEEEFDEEEDGNDSDNESASSQSEIELEDKPSDAIRQDISKMSMGEILKLKEKLGKTLFGEMIGAKKPAGASTPRRRRREEFKRENKNRPREMSSKRPDYTPRIAIQPVKQPERRDPRFEESAGTFDEKIFRHSYKFLDEVRDKERRTLKKQMRKSTDPEEKEKLHFLIKRIDNLQTSNEAKDHKEVVVQKAKAEIKEKTGSQFINKSQLKKEELVEKFKRLKKSGKLDSYMEKKRKKNVSRDRKKLNV